MGFWGLGIVVAPILGPVLGGWLTDNYSWRWVFYINIPIGIASYVMTRLFVFDPPYIKRSRGGVDYWGIGMLAVGIGALQLLLDKGQQEDWFASHLMVGLLGLAIATLAAFVFRELRVTAPVVDLRIFKNRTYSTGTLLMTALGFCLYGSLVLLPLWLQTLLGYPALQAGIAMAPRGLGSFVGMPLIGMALGKLDARKFLAGGLVLAGLTMLRFSHLSLSAGYWDFFWPQFVQGLSLGMMFVPLTTISMGLIPKEQMGNATSIFNLLRNVGGSIGIAIATTLVARNIQTNTNNLASHITPYDPKTRVMMDSITRGMMTHGSPAHTAAQQGYAAMAGMVQKQATILAFVEVFRVLGLIFFLMVPLVLFMKRPPKKAGPVSAH
jgi:DHA2 family multidrug resistance protein